MDYNAPPSSSAAGDSRQKTYKVDAAVEHARNKLETRAAGRVSPKVRWNDRGSNAPVHATTNVFGWV